MAVVPMVREMFVFVLFLAAASGFHRIEAEMFPNGVGQIVVERTRMRLLVVNADLGQKVDDLAGLDLQLSRELVNSNLAHRYLRGALLPFDSCSRFNYRSR